MPFLVGQTVGDYVVVLAADCDATSEVYIVEHTITRRREAMWVLGREGHCAVEDAERLFAEIRYHASLSHPNIVSVHNAFWAGDALVMICELVEGGSLQTALESGPLPLNQALDIMAGVLSALAYSHASGVRPCALSPGRIFLTRDGNVKLLNFGLAPPVGPHDAARATGRPIVDPGGDNSKIEPDELQRCGVLFHELVTGSKPVSRRLFPNFLETRCEESVLRSNGANRHLAAELKDTIETALAAEPGKQFPSLEALRHAVERLREVNRTAAAHPSRIQLPRIATALSAAGFACVLIVVASTRTITAPLAKPSPSTAPRDRAPLAAPVSAPLPAPVPPPVQTPPAMPANSAQTSSNTQAPPPPAQQTHSSRKRKNPIVRLAGAIKRLNPINRRTGGEPAQSQTTPASASLAVSAKPAPSQIIQKHKEAPLGR